MGDPNKKLWAFILSVLACMSILFFNTILLEDQATREIVVILKNKELTEFWAQVKEGIEAGEQQWPANLTFLAGEGEADIKGQKALLEAAIQRQPDAILLAAADYEALEEDVCRVYNSATKIVLIDSGVRGEAYDVFVGTDNFTSGYKAGQLLSEKVAPTAPIYIINYAKGSETALERERGVRTALIDSNHEGLLMTFFCYDDAKSAERIVNHLLEEQMPIGGFIALNETSTVGMAHALAKGQRPGIIAIGYDSSLEEIQYLEAGVLDALVVQKPFNIGYLGMQAADDLLRNRKGVDNIDTGSKVISSQEIYDKENTDLLFPFIE